HFCSPPRQAPAHASYSPPATGRSRQSARHVRRLRPHTRLQARSVVADRSACSTGAGAGAGPVSDVCGGAGSSTVGGFGGGAGAFAAGFGTLVTVSDRLLG